MSANQQSDYVSPLEVEWLRKEVLKDSLSFYKWKIRFTSQSDGKKIRLPPKYVLAYQPDKDTRKQFLDDHKQRLQEKYVIWDDDRSEMLDLAAIHRHFNPEQRAVQPNSGVRWTEPGVKLDGELRSAFHYARLLFNRSNPRVQSLFVAENHVFVRIKFTWEYTAGVPSASQASSQSMGSVRMLAGPSTAYSEASQSLTRRTSSGNMTGTAGQSTELSQGLVLSQSAKRSSSSLAGGASGPSPKRVMTVEDSKTAAWKDIERPMIECSDGSESGFTHPGMAQSALHQGVSAGDTTTSGPAVAYVIHAGETAGEMRRRLFGGVSHSPYTLDNRGPTAPTGSATSTGLELVPNQSQGSQTSYPQQGQHTRSASAYTQSNSAVVPYGQAARTADDPNSQQNATDDPRFVRWYLHTYGYHPQVVGPHRNTAYSHWFTHVRPRYQ